MKVLRSSGSAVGVYILYYVHFVRSFGVGTYSYMYIIHLYENANSHRCCRREPRNTIRKVCTVPYIIIIIIIIICVHAQNGRFCTR